MDNGHVKRSIFKNIPINLAIWADGLNKLWCIWGLSQYTFCHYVFLAHDFPLINHYFYKTTKLLRHFKEVWDLDMNLGCKELGI